MKTFFFALLLFPSFSFAVDLDKIKITAVVEEPILNNNSFVENYYGTGISNHKQELSDLEHLNLRNFDCYIITPIGTSTRDPKFFEKLKDGDQLKSGTKLVSTKGGFTMGGNWGLSEDKVWAWQFDLYFQIEGRRPKRDDYIESEYDLVLSCPAQAVTSVEKMLKGDWSIDIEETLQKANKQLLNILKLTKVETVESLNEKATLRSNINIVNSNRIPKEMQNENEPSVFSQGTSGAHSK